MPVLAGEAEPEQGADRRTQVLGLRDGQVAPPQGVQLSVETLADHQGVDETDHVVLPEVAQDLDDLAVERGVVEAHDEQLHRTDGHGNSLGGGSDGSGAVVRR